MIPETVSPRAIVYVRHAGWSGHAGSARSGSPGSRVGTTGVGRRVGALVGGTTVGVAVGAIVGAGVAGGAVAGGGRLAGVGGVGCRGASEAAATGGPLAATGISRPPRPPTNAMAKTAQAATKTADATIAGVTVRRSRAPLESSTPLLFRVRLAADSSTFSPWPRTSGEC
jgi:hypothetical protein